MEKVDTGDDTIKVATVEVVAAETKPCDIEAIANELDKLATKHAKASFEAMTPKQAQAVLGALCTVRDSLLGSINQPRVKNDETVHQYVDTLLEETNWRLDALYHSLLENRPQDAETRVDWLTALIAYFGKTDCLANEIGYDVPGLIDELQAVTLKGPVQHVPITTSSPTPKPQNSTDFSKAEKQLLDCLEYGEMVGTREDDNTTNEAGYALLDKIHMDVSDVFHRNIDARVVAQADRPCDSIADVKERVALLLQATYDEMDDSIVNDVFAAVRSSILKFARERVTQ